MPHASTPDGWIESEAEYAEAAHAAGAPVPRLLGIERIDGRSASVWERIEGTSMWQRIIDSPTLSAELGDQLGAVQLGLFELVPPVTLPSQRDRLVSKIRRVAATVDGSLAHALDLLPAATGAGRLCHGDLHPSNVILSDDGPIIVDWFDASRGEPLADVARTLLTLLGDGVATPRHLPGSDAQTLAVLADAYLARVAEPLRIDEHELARWQAVEAVARLSEGVQRETLLDVWTRYQRAGGSARAVRPEPAAQTAAS